MRSNQYLKEEECSMSCMEDRYSDYETVMLENIKVGVSKRFCGLSNIDFRKYEEDFGRSFVIDLTAQLYGQRLDDQTAHLKVLVPRNWWQHFKKDHFEFLLRYFPVEYTMIEETHRFEVLAGYPHMKYLPHDKFGEHLLVPMMRREE